MPVSCFTRCTEHTTNTISIVWQSALSYLEQENGFLDLPNQKEKLKILSWSHTNESTERQSCLTDTITFLNILSPKKRKHAHLPATQIPEIWLKHTLPVSIPLMWPTAWSLSPWALDLQHMKEIQEVNNLKGSIKDSPHTWVWSRTAILWIWWWEFPDHSISCWDHFREAFEFKLRGWWWLIFVY